MVRKLSLIAKRKSASRSSGHVGSGVVALTAFTGYLGYVVNDFWKSKVYHKSLMKKVEESKRVHELFNETNEKLLKVLRKNRK